MHVRALIRAALIGAFALCLAAPAGAQTAQTRAIVVTSCGSVALPLNDPHDLYMTADGRLCTNAADAPGLVPNVVRAAPALVAKAAPGGLYGFSFTQGATAGFLAFLDATAIPAANAAINPVECIPVAANTGLRARHTAPDRYLTGIVALSTSSCTAYAAVTPVLMAVSAQ